MDDRFWDRTIFRNISDDSRKAILSMDAKVISYHANERIMEEGDDISDICVILEGVLKSTEYTVDGKELNSSYFFGGEILPGGDAFPFYLVYSGEKKYFFHTYCLKKAKVVWLPVAQLLPIIDADHVFLGNVLRFVSEYTRYSKMMLRCVQYRKVADRLAYWLVRVNDPSTVIRIPNSQEVLADMLHVNRSSLNQALKEMEEEHIITMDGRRIQVLDESALEECI